MVQNQMQSAKQLRVGTRGSLLARTQTGQVVELIRGLWPVLDVQTVTISSSGDRIQDKPLHEFGGKGLFTKELEQAMLAGEIDLAIHSLKDLPVTMPLVDVSTLIFVTPQREDPRDLLVSRKARRVEDLPELMPGFIGHQTERYDEKGAQVEGRYRVRDWDYLGWRWLRWQSTGLYQRRLRHTHRGDRPEHTGQLLELQRRQHVHRDYHGQRQCRQ